MEKILVIDDEKPTLAMFGLLLGAYGYNVLTAESGAAGLELFREERPSIVLTDIKMAGIDGFEVLQRIKEIDPKTEVIVITGHGDMDLAIQALNLNATDFINKPIQKHTLDNALRQAKERLKLTEPCANHISWRQAGEVTILDISGNLTALSEQGLIDAYERVSAQGARKLLLHFDKHSSINGAGIAVLIHLLSESQKRNQVVAIAGLSENFQKILKVVGVSIFASIFDNQEDALSKFSDNNYN